MTRENEVCQCGVTEICDRVVVFSGLVCGGGGHTKLVDDNVDNYD